MLTRTRVPLLFLAALALVPGVALADTAARPFSLPRPDITTAFGESYVVGVTVNVPNRYTYAGRVVGVAGAPMDFRNRSYSPSLGRYSRRDPKLGGDPLYNAYGFPGEDPVMGTDPMGTDYTKIDGNKAIWVIEGRHWYRNLDKRSVEVGTVNGNMVSLDRSFGGGTLGSDDFMKAADAFWVSFGDISGVSTSAQDRQIKEGLVFFRRAHTQPGYGSDPHSLVRAGVDPVVSIGDFWGKAFSKDYKLDFGEAHEGSAADVAGQEWGQGAKRTVQVVLGGALAAEVVVGAVVVAPAALVGGAGGGSGAAAGGEVVVASGTASATSATGATATLTTTAIQTGTAAAPLVAAASTQAPRITQAVQQIGPAVAQQAPQLIQRGAPQVAQAVTQQAPSAFGNLSQAGQYGIVRYGDMINRLQGTGLQAHKLIEKRFLPILQKLNPNMTTRNIPSVAVTGSEHQQEFTNAFRQWISYGQGTANANPEELRKAVEEVYRDYPALLRAALDLLKEGGR